MEPVLPSFFLSHHARIPLSHLNLPTVLVVGLPSVSRSSTTEKRDCCPGQVSFRHSAVRPRALPRISICDCDLPLLQFLVSLSEASSAATHRSASSPVLRSSSLVFSVFPNNKNLSFQCFMWVE
ncbi:hypothetical protein K1719_047009 [Acacia pycnantha]|nr:hypothetical protein K1719_047009 [Acacia pycnantha]